MGFITKYIKCCCITDTDDDYIPPKNERIKSKNDIILINHLKKRIKEKENKKEK